MISASKTLVVGGGIAGMATAICLQRSGVAVELIDRDPDWRVYGAGITITGPTLRAYRRLGLLERIKAEGAISNGTQLYHFSGAPIAELDEPAIEEGLPATGGIMRPVLHRIMSEEVRRLGISVRLGITVAHAQQDTGAVEVSFSDGRCGRYDLVVGADGVYSQMRALIFREAPKPRFTGQGSWRIVAERPQDLNKICFFLGHANMVGITPCSDDSVYVFILETDRERLRIDQQDEPARVRSLLADFGGRIVAIREGVGPHSSIVHRPLESVLLPKPWHSGRIVLVGDAVHATTPHLASGAGMAVEDALVLTEEINRGSDNLEHALTAYTQRRFERCRFVVERSLEIGEVQMAQGSSALVGEMSGNALHRLAEDI
jgi:2-polyprenyl-6-methoxyphenol hydroxylase-like FAD-dependent oxidoreductase